MADVHSTTHPVCVQVGNRFGKLVVIESAPPRGKHKDRKFWLMQCDCGALKVVIQDSLTRKTHPTRSCGCIRGRQTKHSHCSNGSSPTYVSWRLMWNRCKRRKNHNYYRYGGAGITVCDRWRSFESFLEDMGEKPEGCSIDRIDGTGNYTPENCRWATRKQQQRNRKNNRLITYNGQTLCLAEWNEKLKMGKDGLSTRLRLGWSVHRAITQPVKKRRESGNL